MNFWWGQAGRDREEQGRRIEDLEREVAQLVSLLGFVGATLDQGLAERDRAAE